MIKQKTIVDAVSLSGVGVHNGKKVTLTAHIAKRTKEEVASNSGSEPSSPAV